MGRLLEGGLGGGENPEDAKAEQIFIDSLLRFKIGEGLTLEELKLTENLICCVC